MHGQPERHHVTGVRDERSEGQPGQLTIVNKPVVAAQEQLVPTSAVRTTPKAIAAAARCQRVHDAVGAVGTSTSSVTADIALSLVGRSRAGWATRVTGRRICRMIAGVAKDPDEGAPVGRRVVLGLLALAGIGVAVRIESHLGDHRSGQERPRMGLTGPDPGGGRFRFYPWRAPWMRSRVFRHRRGWTVRLSTRGIPPSRTSPPSTDPPVKDVQCVTGWRCPTSNGGGRPALGHPEQVRPKASATALEFGSSDGIYTESLTLDQAQPRHPRGDPHAGGADHQRPRGTGSAST